MDQRISKALVYIKDNLDRALDLKEVAKAACLSTSHFHRLFKKEMGLSLRKYVEKSKLEEAYSLLIDGKILVQDLALDLGYRDYETFSRAFKRQYFLSPDDLKAIALNLRNRIANTPGEDKEVLILTLELEDYTTILEELKKVLLARNLNFEEFSDSETIIVKPLLDKDSKNPKDIIKNKFVIENGAQLKRDLLH